MVEKYVNGSDPEYLASKPSRRNLTTRHPNGALKQSVERGWRVLQADDVFTMRTRTGEKVDLRSKGGRAFMDYIVRMTNDLGGIENCTMAQVSLVRRAAALEMDLRYLEAEAIAKVGNQDARLDPHVYPVLAKAQRQILATRAGLGNLDRGISGFPA